MGALGRLVVPGSIRRLCIIAVRRVCVVCVCVCVCVCLCVGVCVPSHTHMIGWVGEVTR